MTILDHIQKEVATHFWVTTHRLRTTVPEHHSTNLSALRPKQVWCVGASTDNQTRHSVNKTVEGAALSAVLKGLLPGVVYQVEVAAVTSAGVGTRSQPVTVVISESSHAEEEEEGGEGWGRSLNVGIKEMFMLGLVILPLSVIGWNTRLFRPRIVDTSFKFKETFHRFSR